MVKLIETNTEFELSPTLAINKKVEEKRSKGTRVLHMGFGQAPFPVHPRLKKALTENTFQNKYLPTHGLQELCDTVKQHYETKTGLDTSQYDILIAPGSKLILYALQMAIEGDLIMPVPSWVSYAPQAHMLKTNVVKVPANLSEDGFSISITTLRNTVDKARANGLNPSKLILNSPSNPTGLNIPEGNLKEIAQFCIDEDIFIISDEIYGLVSFDNTYRTIAKYARDNTAITSGLSKHLSLGGWRIGVGLIPKSINGLQNLLCNIASETWSCVPAPIQYAAIEAYKGHEDVEEYISQCTDIHALINKYISEGLQRLGVIAHTAQGGFYNYPDFAPYRKELNKSGIETSKQLSKYLIDNHNLASLPGIAFGANPSDLTLRLSGCDYDGAKAIAAYQNGEELNETFIEKYAPNVKAQAQAFENFINEMKA